jgi:dipeptidyl aminopeptidase/acylaminoacyl peptidase
MKNSIKLFTFVVLITTLIISKDMFSQEKIKYQLPPKEIVDLIDAPVTPMVRINSTGDKMLLLFSPALPGIEELSQPELGLAGVRINPITNGPSRSGYYKKIVIKNIVDKKETEIKGLPENARIENVSWSPDDKKIAFTLTKADGIELWTVLLETGEAKRLTEPILNNFFRGNPYIWLSNSNSIVYQVILTERITPPEKNLVPDGPIVQSSIGTKAPARTFQDLLKNEYDEKLFEYYAASQLVITDLDGNSKIIGQPGIISELEPSPDGNYLLIGYTKRPYSYTVPFDRFATEFQIIDKNGKLIKLIADIPVAETIPISFDAVRKGPRDFTWRNDVPASLYWVEAQDDGDPKKTVDIRDKIFYMNAPFDQPAKESGCTQLRFAGFQWFDANLAMVSEYFWSTRRTVISSFNPSNPMTTKSVIFDRNYEDKYSDPGSFEQKKNQWGKFVLLSSDAGKTFFLTGLGASNEGNRPFLDEFKLAEKKSKRLWQSAAPYYEEAISLIDLKKMVLITRKESVEESPNYFIRNLKSNKIEKLTEFADPYPGLKGIKGELIKYQRKDSIQLTGKLYLPSGWKKENGRLPVLMWAYPEEFKSANAAGQVNDSPYRFIRISPLSPLLWVTQGYAVFDHPSMPIIGEGKNEPNDTYIEQLTANAEAAIKKLDELGVADTKKIAVGGHSYGAFMTANLLAHSELFAAGIARSGAYNRTLTPFGFQSEERTLWEAKDTYIKMSPFMYAEKIKAPILLIHGGDDNNPGTFTLQSERLFSALKGVGATVRFVNLPKESHGYRARESVMHMCWEMTEWLNKYVKNK